MMLFTGATQAGTALILSNTVMGFAAGVALILLVVFASRASGLSHTSRRAWAWTFGALGSILSVIGVHTTVAWPLLGAANLIFGEPSVVFGFLLLATAAIIHQTPVKGTDETKMHSGDSSLSGVRGIPEKLLVALRPVAYVGAFAGPMLTLLAVGGAAFGEIVFRPPPNEFPTGIIAGTGIESVYFIVNYGLLGLGAMLLPLGLHNRYWLKPAAYLFVVSGILLLIVTYASFMGHVSLSTGVPP